MNRRRQLLLTAATALATLSVMTPPPAEATVYPLQVFVNGKLKARATWDSDTDVLCVKAIKAAKGAKAVASWGNGAFARLTDFGGNDTGRCRDLTPATAQGERRRLYLTFRTASGTKYGPKTRIVTL